MRPCARLALLGVAVALSTSPLLVRGQVLAPDALLGDFRWRNVGPANMAGRVTDIEAVESNPAVVIVAAASGGLWKSINAGTTWEPVFDGYCTASMGDVAIFQGDPDIIWVGTGESCTRNSVGRGDGVYRSGDGGKTFVNVGLRDTHHIGEVVTHPTDPDVVYVAAQGHLWGHAGQRGVFKTTDGGKTWQRLWPPADEIYVGDYDLTGGKILVFPRTTSANVAPSRVISGASTQLGGWIAGLAVHPSLPELYALTGVSGFPSTARIVTFAVSATGNATPIRVIAGGATLLEEARSLDYDARRDELVVLANAQGGGTPAVLRFARTAQGDVAPVGVLSGPSTGLANLAGVLSAVPDRIFRDGFETGP